MGFFIYCKDSEDDDLNTTEGNEKGSEDEGSDGEGSDGEVEADGGSDGVEAEDEEDQNGDVEENPNAGWAEAMAKILGKKTPDDKPCILLKNKQLDKINEKERKERLEKKKQVILVFQDLSLQWDLVSNIAVGFSTAADVLCNSGMFCYTIHVELETFTVILCGS